MKTLAAVAFVLGFAFGPERSSQDVTVVKAGDVKWVEAKGHPAGVKSCLIHGDPSKGAFVLLLKIPAGTTYKPHWHSADEVVVVQSGSVVVGGGEKMDETKGTAVDTGGYFSFKAKAPHWGIAKEDTVLVRYGNGPADITFCEK